MLRFPWNYFEQVALRAMLTFLTNTNNKGDKTCFNHDSNQSTKQKKKQCFLLPEAEFHADDVWWNVRLNMPEVVTDWEYLNNIREHKKRYELFRSCTLHMNLISRFIIRNVCCNTYFSKQLLYVHMNTSLILLNKAKKYVKKFFFCMPRVIFSPTI